ncbi:sulfatase-like hydrolase/transferase [Niabella ginsengisoli]|uniref:Sulfatase-like hydrolase/transferase n=1 Tax=Niabella ginsengisoli TaxID=522298 RepID=A0ABS9SGL4_9BACT|nr:sulfatase-like hydrolase/transferase [Niabella ginsengisoli]MCH5597506.1 sulfatase-like hydrolase/transferase [Niabella ginsengisoli]
MQIKFIKRLIFIFCAIIPTLVFTSTLKAQSNSKPNIVFILADDQAWYTIHALGNNEIETPNLDRLVRMGKSFTNAYNMGAWGGAVCVASRAMFISGRTIWHAKELDNKWHQGQAINQTWGKIMEEGGYATFMTGKWHVEVPAEKVFNVVTDIRPGMPEYKTPAKAALPGNVTNKNLNIPGYNRPLNVNDDTWSPYDTSFGGYWEGGVHWSVVFKNHSLEHIHAAAKQDKPFFLYLASNAPHDPRQSPKDYVDRYPLDKISMPKSFLPVNPYKDSIGNSAGLRDEALAPFPRTELAIKMHTREYYAAITFLDKQIGDILDALETTGKMNNTYIFFTADHGLAMGRHGFMGKQTLFEHSMKPPLIVIGPGIPKNTICNTPVYIQDIVATSIELAQVKKPAYVGFESFLSLAKGSSQKRFMMQFMAHI